jgi:3-phenylpropionate/cinnamic acid dioxygenase small subunit
MMQLESKANLVHEISQFLFREARYADDHCYEQWEALWTDDGVYWIPANGDDIDPDRQMSIIYDNRSRIGLRVRQLMTGKRHTQEPQSRLRRIVGDIELLKSEGRELHVACNTMIFESALRGDIVWASRNEFVLRRDDEDFKIARKKVALVNNDRAIFTLSFLV